MALQTNVLRDGQWRTETVNLHTILKGTSTPNPPAEDTPPEPPSCGILTRTIVESPVAHWVLPARLRSARYNDVVFVGDHYVQVNELREGGQLHEILKKADFGSRIQNAHVIGNLFERPEAGDDDMAYDEVKHEEEGLLTSGYSSTTPRRPKTALPPHLLFLVLESGSFVFLFIRRYGNQLRFVASQFCHPGRRLGNLGFHVAVDPNSRYIAVAGVDNKFIVYELESWEVMAEQFSRHMSINPIKTYFPRPVQALIHKMEFLHPRPEDDFHVILLLILVKQGASSMVLYDWERGDDLERALSVEKHGHRMPRQHRMPLFLVPLTVRNSFLLVSENSIAVCKDPLQGPPAYEGLDPGTHPTTSYYHGLQRPLWTAWDRPVRRRGYYEGKDNIYLAREDGVIVFLEFNTTDVVEASMNVGSCNCTISTAFTTMYDAFTDVAIVMGDSGLGMICQLRPREPLVELGTIPNWSPALDFVTTDEFTSWDQRASPRGNLMADWRDHPGPRPRKCDRMFAISGKGMQGSVTELRWGLAANVGWEIPYGSPVKQAWVFAAAGLPVVGSGYYLLLALPDSSDVLQVSGGDSLEVDRPDPDIVQFDMGSRTLAAAQFSDQSIVQVTETSITLITTTQSVRYRYDSFPGIEGKVEQATVRACRVAVSTRAETQSFIHTFSVDSADASASLSQTFNVTGEVTSLAFGQIGDREQLLAGIWHENEAYLAVYALDENNEVTPILNRLEADFAVETATNEGALSLEAITIIAIVDETASATSIALGCRSGYLVMMTMMSGHAPLQVFVSRQKLASVALDVFPVHNRHLPGSVLACCDEQLVLFQDFDARQTGRFRQRHRIIANDVKDPKMTSPPINHATVLRHSIGQSDHVSVLILSNDRVLVSELFPKPRAIPRYLPLHGTPTKLLFSQTMQSLVVAMRTRSGEATLAIVDPDSGEDISVPTEKEGRRVDFINGLGKSAGRIHDMVEWVYEKDGRTWLYLVVTTKEGQLLVVSTERAAYSSEEGGDMSGQGGSIRRIRYWTRYKKTVGEHKPIYAVVGDGPDLIYCVGQTLYWDVLDLNDRKLRGHTGIELPSPAISLRLVKGMVYVLTLDHSLLIYNFKAGGQLVHSDVGSRHATHYIEMGDSRDETLGWPVTLICELTREFVGVWVPWKEPGKEFQVVFEGRLPAGVRRLRRGRVRPSWLALEPRFGHIPSTVDGADIFGMCLNGSLQHFSLLSTEAWRFLRLVQTLVVRRQRASDDEAHREDDASMGEGRPVIKPHDAPRNKHIDGDVLQRCLDARKLEELFSHGQDTRLADLLRERLDSLDGGKWTTGFNGSHQKYVELAYDVVEYYLSPVF
ncbi:hypothetical protein SODALDRAFT_277774 [Sodiomyces alkalinus F11]|uniref:Uncharacterized protein n=1 Tax=Sodiomyces alkalinus (strain CBS 110278 / VKM F-3762 / F11) TaxID=1314773 RepID=A0A3N2PWD4_SODAK|nr:hypothetical protein SODALDRAFT_277774 [Sodiomyces alkalinus F11]ROT38696.1 hypothetical protein SODALDRAFT_277774 [Sodiomyces alkalinus F11]